MSEALEEAATVVEDEWRTHTSSLLRWRAAADWVLGISVNSYYVFFRLLRRRDLALSDTECPEYFLYVRLTRRAIRYLT